MHTTFNTNPKRNLVEIAITYQQLNNREAIGIELEFIQTLSQVLMNAESILKRDDLLVVPQIHNNANPYTGSIDLKFEIKHPKGKCYDYVELYATLECISAVCNQYREQFVNFNSYLNLKAMRKPWVLPVGSSGMIVREDSLIHDYTGEMPITTVLHKDEVEQVSQLVVVGEYRAVEDFKRILASETKRKGYTTLDVNALKRSNPKLAWQHFGVFVRLTLTDEWVQLGEMHSQATLDYLEVNFSDLLHTGFLEGCGYYRFETPLV